MESKTIDTNKLIYKTETDSQTESKLWLQRGKRKGKRIFEFEINRYTLLYIKEQQGPTIEHRELYSVSYSSLYGKII